MTPEPVWPDRLAAVIAGEIRRYRDMRGLTAQGLADKCESLGMAIPRSVLANLESGRRTTVTVAEVLVIAAALSVAPVLLVFPVGRKEDSEYLPGATCPTWSAALWFGGHADFPDPELDEEHREQWSERRGYSLPIELFARHQNTRERWRQAAFRVISLRRRARTENGDIKGAYEDAQATVADIETNLRDLREQMQAAGFIPPRVTGELADRLGAPPEAGEVFGL